MPRRMRLIPLIFLVSACKGETAKEVTAAVVGKAVEVTKGAGTGVVTGIEEGRKGTESTDGSRTLSKPDEVFASTELQVIEVKPASPKGVEVVLAVTNKATQPIHLLGLRDGGGAQLVDKEGFFTPLLAGAPGQLGEAIEIPPSAKVKATLIFEGNAAKAAQVRLWGRQFPVPAGAATAKAQP
ncbi:hypothetical protein [Archangium lansingense]|uniref:DUF4352 domain-containing protein n=1 Tax=Archangium lansingense TaxID=2995310 RepID=A0ABT4AFL2_9BACT|nr:hypothetical protein [Archangium lansinium]MCY1080468.1 hypothetical protein [Archangium lansinium]